MSHRVLPRTKILVVECAAGLVNLRCSPRLPFWCLVGINACPA